MSFGLLFLWWTWSLAMMSSRIYCVTTSVQLMMTTFWGKQSFFNNNISLLIMSSYAISSCYFIENLGCGALNQTTLSVKDLQNVLREDQSMSPQCFNIAVRFPAYHEFRKLTYCSNNIPKHFMDLCFCVSFLPSFTHPQCYSHHWKSEFSSSNYLSKFSLTQIMWLSVITRKKHSAQWLIAIGDWRIYVRVLPLYV